MWSKRYTTLGSASIKKHSGCTRMSVVARDRKRAERAAGPAGTQARWRPCVLGNRDARPFPVDIDQNKGAGFF